MPAYCGPRFYRVVAEKGERKAGSAHGENYGGALAEARLLKTLGYVVRIESLDDRYPANVINSREI